MSRKPRKTDGRECRTNESGPTGRPSWGVTILIAALALVASAVFFVKLTSPKGVVGAFTGQDLARFAANEKAGTPPNWKSIYQEYDAALKSMPSLHAHAAIRRLLYLVLQVDRGHIDITAASAEIESLAQYDPNNLVMRAALAVLRDQAHRPTTTASFDGEASLARYKVVESSFRGQGPAAFSTLHNKELTAAWFEILAKHFSRRDVAVAWALYPDLENGQVIDHFAALPIIQRRLLDLAQDLDRNGHHADARQCRRWVVQMGLGVLKSETDSGTRLLCADLVSNALEDNPTGAKAMRQLKADFLTVAESAPVELVDPARTPAVDPTGMRAIVKRLIVTLVFAAMAAGSAIALGAATVLAPVAAVIRRRSGDGETLPKPALDGRRVLWRIVLTLGIPVLASFYLGGQVASAGIYSEAWMIAVLASLAAIGGQTVVLNVLAIIIPSSNTQEANAKGRVGIADWIWLGLGVVFPACFVLFPAPPIAACLRSIDKILPSPIALGMLFALMLLISLWRLRAGLRSVARVASLTWLLCTMAAWMALWNLAAHSGSAYQDVVASRRLDEVAARLGDNWQAKYLDPWAAEYDILSK